MTQGYNASAIEVLTGLDPVRRRPGMYTDTTRPNHLAQEVIDNSVDEALAGHANRLDVVLHHDDSLSVRDNGRGMPVDIHPEEGLPGIELILTRLHAGGKFSHNNYTFSGGLHGVGVSVVNALSQRLDVRVRRNGQEYQMTFAHGDKASELQVIGSVGRRTTGTTLHFWPDPRYFDSPRFSVPRLKHILRAKAVLCSGLTVTFHNEADDERCEWCYRDGLSSYLHDALRDLDTLPAQPFTGHLDSAQEAAEWALCWLPEGGESVTESYVNLIPTPLGGTHVNGLRSGLTEALREFCEFRALLPRGVRITPEDVWEGLSYVLSVKLRDPQFSGQTKERLSSRECAAFVSGVVKDRWSLWLNQHVEVGEQIAQLVLSHAHRRLRQAKKVVRKRVASGPALPGKLADCTAQDLRRTELFLVEGDSAGGSAKQARDREFQAIMPLRGKIEGNSAGGSAKQARDREFQAIMPLRGKIQNTWEVDSAHVLGSQEIHDIAVALGVDPGSDSLSGLRYGKVCILADADSDGLHIATLLCALFLRHFRPLVAAGHVYVAMPPLYRIDVGKAVYYALDEAEKQGVLDRLAAEQRSGKISVTRFKGLGEMSPLQLRETTMAPDTRRLVQLTVSGEHDATALLDMLLAKKRAADRRGWLEAKGGLAEVPGLV